MKQVTRGGERAKGYEENETSNVRNINTRQKKRRNRRISYMFGSNFQIVCSLLLSNCRCYNGRLQELWRLPCRCSSHHYQLAHADFLLSPVNISSTIRCQQPSTIQQWGSITVRWELTGETSYWAIRNKDGILGRNLYWCCTWILQPMVSRFVILQPIVSRFVAPATYRGRLVPKNFWDHLTTN